MASDRPIFIAGCPRSGTTLAQLMLHAHPRIAIPPETRFLYPVYYGRLKYGDLRQPDNRRELGKAIIAKGRRFADLGLNARETVEQIVAGPPTVGSALGIVFREYARKYGKPRWGDKRPGYHAHLPSILRMFPDAQIIHLVRDGRDCVASLKNMPWWQGDTNRSIAAWMLGAANARRAARRLSSDTFYILEYERLVDDPATELRKVCAFLGEDYDDAMTRPAEQAKVAVPDYKVWHNRTHEEVNTAAVGGWQDKLEPWEQGLCEAVMARQLRRFGYPLTDAGPRPGPGQLLAYNRTMARRRREVLDRRVKDRYALLRGTGPVQAVLTEGQEQRLSASERAWIAGSVSPQPAS